MWVKSYLGSSHRLFIPVIILWLCLTYGNSLKNGYVWDDHEIAEKAPSRISVSVIYELFMGADVVFEDEPNAYYRPLNRLSYALERGLWGDSPKGGHAVNIAIHGLNALLLYVLIYSFIRDARFALFGALLFAVHPINAESVNLISARNNLLAGLFSLGAFLAYGRQEAKVSVGSAFLFFLGLLSKETAAMVLLIIIYTDARAASGIKEYFERRLCRLFPFGLALALYAGLRYAALKGQAGLDAAGGGLLTRLTLNVYTIPEYLKKIILPINLSMYYEFSIGDFKTYWLWVFWLAILVGIWYVVSSGDALMRFGMLWFFINLIPVSHIIPIPSAMMADRYMYMPAMGLFMVAAALGRRLYAHFPQAWIRNITVAAGVMGILSYTGVTHIRNQDWKDDISVFSRILKVNPDSVTAMYNLANALRLDDLPRAKGLYQRVIERAPTHSQARNQLGNIAFLAGDLKEAQYQYLEALTIDARNAEAHYNLAMIYERLGDFSSAVKHYESFLSRVPPEYQISVPEIRQRVVTLRERLNP